MGLIYLGILLCSIAFAIVVIYISFVLKRFSNTIGSLATTLDHVEKEMQHITPQLKQSIQEAHKVVDDVEEKLKATDSLFDTVDNVGVSMKSLNQTFGNNINRLSGEQFEKKLNPFIEGMKWSETAFFLYSKWKGDQPAKSKNKDINVAVNQTGKEG